MVEEVKKTDSNTKTQLSLAAALFFSPLVQHMLTTNSRELNEEEKNFIRSYIKVGYITLAFWLLTLAAGIMNYLFALNILNVVYIVSISLLVFLLVISMVSILSDITLLKWGQYALPTYTVEGEKKDILITYLPLYSIYLWYKIHNFEKPNWWIKEALLIWMLFSILTMTWGIWITSISLIVVIIRIASLMSGIDILSISLKQRLNKLFIKNPEEIRGYVVWSCSYLIKWLFHLVVTMQPYTLHDEIIQAKKSYEQILSLEEPVIIWEYILWIILTIGLVYFIPLDFTVRTYYIGFWLIIWRYLLMGLQLKHLPHLPLARELILLGKIIGDKVKKLFIPNNS